MSDKTLTLTSSGVDTTSATGAARLDPPDPGPNARHTQFAQIGVSTADGTAAGATGILRFVLRDSTEIYAMVEAVIAIPTTAQGRIIDGSGATRVCTVTFPNGTAILDLLGANKNAGAGAHPWAAWYVMCPAVPAGVTIGSGMKINITWGSGPGL